MGNGKSNSDMNPKGNKGGTADVDLVDDKLESHEKNRNIKTRRQLGDKELLEFIES